MAAIAAWEFAEFNRLLASAVERGLALEPSVELLAAQARGGVLRGALTEVARALREGAPLPEALARHPRVFSPDYVELVRAAHRDGRLAEALRYVQTDHALRSGALRKSRGIMVYLLFGFVVFEAVMGVFGLLSSHLKDYYKILVWDIHDYTEHPLMSEPLASYLSLGWLPMVVMAVVFALGVLLLLVLRSLARRSRAGYWIPVWGRLQKSRDLAYLCTTAALRLRAGVALGEAFAAAGASMTHRHARTRARALVGRLREGEPLSSALFYDRFFPRTLAWAVSLGEARGEVPAVLDTFARVYTTELERNYGMLVEILAPIGVLALGNLALAAFLLVMAPLLMVFQSINTIH